MTYLGVFHLKKKFYTVQSGWLSWFVWAHSLGSYYSIIINSHSQSAAAPKAVRLPQFIHHSYFRLLGPWIFPWSFKESGMHLKVYLQVGCALHTCNSCTSEVQARGSGVQSQLWNTVSWRPAPATWDSVSKKKKSIFGAEGISGRTRA